MFPPGFTPVRVKLFLELHPYGESEKTCVLEAVSSHLCLAGDESFVVLVWRLQSFLPLDSSLSLSLA